MRKSLTKRGKERARSSAGPFAAFEVGLVPGVANIALVKTTSIASRTRIAKVTIFRTVVIRFAALGTLGDSSPVRAFPSLLRFFAFATIASHHEEQRGHDREGYVIHRDPLQLSKSALCPLLQT
jgi:hypothetical protein